MKYRIISVLVVVFFSHVVFANPHEPVSLYYILDDSAKFKVKEVYRLFLNDQTHFKRAGHSVNIGFEASHVWVVFKPSGFIGLNVMMVKNAFLDSIEVYFVRNGQVLETKKTGDHFNFDTRDIKNNYFNFLIPSGTDHILFEVKTQGPLLVPVEIYSLKEFTNVVQGSLGIHFTYFGFIILTFILSVIGGVWLKESIFIYYALALLGTALITLVDFGYAFQYFWPHKPYLNEYSILFYLFAFFNIFFIEKLLNIKQLSKVWTYVYRIFYIVFFLVFSSLALFSYRIVNEMMVYLFIVLPILPLLSGMVLYKRLPRKTISYFIFGGASFFLSMVVYVMTVNGTISYNLFTGNSIQFGSAIEIIFFNLAILNRTRIVKREKEEFLLEQNRMLEEKVFTRTLELKEKNTEIELKNKLLQNQHDHLEEIVEGKTREIIVANKQLNEKNIRLEQFAHVTAHNLRGPVATIRGLCEIFDKKNIKDPINITIIDSMKETGEKADQILKDLSKLLDLNRTISPAVKMVKLDDVLSDVKISLNRQILDIGAQITNEFSSAPAFMGSYSYLNNIFYSLIENSLKFRIEGRTPMLHISSRKDNGFVKIVFKDNGLGLNLQLYREKIFQPYKRFHLDIPGKGLGLYVTKNLVEAMGGKIEVEGEKDKGITFTVLIPYLEK